MAKRKSKDFPDMNIPEDLHNKIQFPGDLKNPYIITSKKEFKKMFKKECLLGKGLFTVKLYVHKKTNQKVAVKKVDYNEIVNTSLEKQNDGTRSPSTLEAYHLQKEIEALIECRNNPHRNVVQLYGLGVYKKIQKIYICTEVMDFNLDKIYREIYSFEGKLENERKKQGFEKSLVLFPPKLIPMIICPVVNALSYIHSKNIIHRDIKPSNILLTLSGLVKICDFGWSKPVDISDPKTSHAGTAPYVPPEITRPGTNRDTKGKAFDSWSIGIVLSILCLGKHPFSGNVDINKPIETLNFIQKIRDQEEDHMKIINPVFDPYPETFRDFATECLTLDETSRAVCFKLNSSDSRPICLKDHRFYKDYEAISNASEQISTSLKIYVDKKNKNGKTHSEGIAPKNENNNDGKVNRSAPESLAIGVDSSIEVARNSVDDSLSKIEEDPICETEILQSLDPLNNVLTLWNFQKEYVENSLKNLNSIILAPTSSGKTCMAIYIIEQHIMASKEQKDGNFKVVFFVPTVPLLTQQANVAKRYLKNIKIIKISGEDGLPLNEAIENYDLLIITPRLLVDLLEDSLETPDPFDISKFSLMIFDECHHTNKSHDYNEIMHYYRKTKFEQKAKKLPQILGLTATIPSGKSKLITKGVESKKVFNLRILFLLLKNFFLVLKPNFEFVALMVADAVLCANLDAFISFIKNEENKKELDDFIAIGIDEVEECVQEYKDSKVYKKLFKMLGDYKQIVMTLIKDLIDDEDFLRNNLTNVKIYDDQTRLTSLENRVSRMNDDEVKNDRVRIMKSLSVLKIILYTIEYLRLFDSSIAINYLIENVNEVFNSDNQQVQELKSRAQENIIEIRSLDNQSKFESVMLRKLFEIISQHFDKYGNDCRILVFPKQKEYAKTLSALLNQKWPFTADYILGTEQMSQNEQLQKIQDFDSGKILILCATSVLEEGLDIGKVNLVIKYAYVTNEWANIQRRGRCRSSDSRSILITDNPKEISQEERNKCWEEQTNQALETIKGMPIEDFRSRIAEKEVEIFRTHLELRKAKNDKKLELGNKCQNYRAVCKDCSNLVSNGEDLRIFGNHYVSIDKTIWDRIKISRSESVNQNQVFDGKIFCKCGIRLGRIKKYQNIDLPIISFKSILFEVRKISPKKSEKFEKVQNKFAQWSMVTESLFAIEDFN